MRYLVTPLLLLSLFSKNITTADKIALQSPYLSVKVEMDSARSSGMHYEIKMKICELKDRKSDGNAFRHDTSQLDFLKLSAANINCGNYMASDEGLERISGDKEPELLNGFHYGNQHFAWEKVLVFEINNRSSRGLVRPMHIVVPIKYRSFLTRVKLNHIIFEDDTVIWLTGDSAVYSNNWLEINQSLDKEVGVRTGDFKLKELL